MSEVAMTGEPPAQRYSAMKGTEPERPAASDVTAPLASVLRRALSQSPSRVARRSRVW